MTFQAKDVGGFLVVGSNFAADPACCCGTVTITKYCWIKWRWTFNCDDMSKTVVVEDRKCQEAPPGPTIWTYDTNISAYIWVQGDTCDSSGDCPDGVQPDDPPDADCDCCYQDGCSFSSDSTLDGVWAGLFEWFSRDDAEAPANCSGVPFDNIGFTWSYSAALNPSGFTPPWDECSCIFAAFTGYSGSGPMPDGLTTSPDLTDLGVAFGLFIYASYGCPLSGQWNIHAGVDNYDAFNPFSCVETAGGDCKGFSSTTCEDCIIGEDIISGDTAFYTSLHRRGNLSGTIHNNTCVPPVGASNQTVGKVQSLIRETPLTCIHRSTSFSTMGCSTCGGNVQIKVFQCSVHGRCTQSKKLPQIKSCQGCTDRVAKKS